MPDALWGTDQPVRIRNEISSFPTIGILLAAIATEWTGGPELLAGPKALPVAFPPADFLARPLDRPRDPRGTATVPLSP